MLFQLRVVGKEREEIIIVFNFSQIAYTSVVSTLYCRKSSYELPASSSEKLKILQ
jgi:hypothetical protein